MSDFSCNIGPHLHGLWWHCSQSVALSLDQLEASLATDQWKAQAQDAAKGLNSCRSEHTTDCAYHAPWLSSTTFMSQICTLLELGTAIGQDAACCACRASLKKIPSNLKVTQAGDIHIMPIESIPEAEDLTAADMPEFDQPTKLALLGRTPSKRVKSVPLPAHSPGTSSPNRCGLFSRNTWKTWWRQPAVSVTCDSA